MTAPSFMKENTMDKEVLEVVKSLANQVCKNCGHDDWQCSICSVKKIFKIKPETEENSEKT